jgi:putative endonuclease
MNKRDIGKLGEKYAEKLLISQGYRIINKNFRSRFGEIDLVAFDYATKEIAFVEVKTRTSDFFGEPQDAVNHSKKRKILKTALYFLNSPSRNNHLGWRVDVIAVKLNTPDGTPKITHFKNIFNGTGLSGY